MTRKTDKKNSREKKEKTFDEYYKEKILATRGAVERVNIVCEKLKNKYADYEETKEFIDYLKSMESVFMSAEKESWSVEKTEDELIRGEIYLMSQTTGIDEEVFVSIYEEFSQTNHSVEKIQKIASTLVEKYSNIEDCFECEGCIEFIRYVKDALLVFSKSLEGNEAFDEISEVKMEFIKLQMHKMSEDDRPPLEVLQEIYEDFVEELKK